MNIPIIGRFLDERFFEHRRRSTSIAGIVAAEMSMLLFAWYFFTRHVIRWDLLAIGLTFVVVKLSVMAWYYFNE